MEFRHEWKHEITASDLAALRARLRILMTQDSHGVEGRYRVRSLYFDTPADKALWEKRNGVDPREKFRLRYYMVHNYYLYEEDGVLSIWQKSM